MLPDYDYGSGTAAPGHHAVTSASIGGNAHTFSYDADGNMTQYDCTPATCEDKYIGWNARNLPTTVTLGDSLTDTTPTAKDEFAYGPNGQRYYKKSTWDDAGALRTEHTFYVGRFEEVLYGDPPNYSSIQKTRVTDTLLHVRTTSADGMTVVSAMEYLHRDHLGSVEAVTDAGGASLLVQAYDPFGERRKSDWMGMLSASERQTLADNQPLQTSRGYTGHEHLDRTGFIHMNGRLYDPQLGRFLSPDPIVAAPGSSQSWNSYSYVSNSPLSFVDPGGQFQAGIGCNVGYVMCMNGGGNTSGGGGGSGQGSETATIRTYQTHTVHVVDWVPSSTWNPGGGSIYGGGDIFGGGDINNGTHGDIYGGIFGDVWGGNETIQYTPFVTTFSYAYWNTETRQIQNPAEEQSPASRPMGAGVQQEQQQVHYIDDPGIEPSYLIEGVLLLPWRAAVAAVRGVGSIVGWVRSSSLMADDALRVGEFSYTKTAGNHVNDIVKSTGQLSRPYLSSPHTIREIMATGRSIPDPGGVAGALRFDVSGTFRGSQGMWELVVHPQTYKIYHFNFVK